MHALTSKPATELKLKTLLTLSAATFLTVSAFGQGQVVFQNLDTTITPNVRSPIYLDFVGGALLNGTDQSLHAALIGGTTSLVPANVPGSRTNTAGGPLFTAGTLAMLASPVTGSTWTTFRTGAASGFVGVGTDVARVVADVPYGGQAQVQIVAWNGSFTTW